MKRDKENENRAIGCTVETCKFHCKPENYCSLNNIEVGCCIQQPKHVDSTCCNSFQVKSAY